MLESYLLIQISTNSQVFSVKMKKNLGEGRLYAYVLCYRGQEHWVATQKFSLLLKESPGQSWPVILG